MSISRDALALVSGLADAARSFTRSWGGLGQTIFSTPPSVDIRLGKELLLATGTTTSGSCSPAGEILSALAVRDPRRWTCHRSAEISSGKRSDDESFRGASCRGRERQPRAPYEACVAGFAGGQSRRLNLPVANVAKGSGGTDMPS